MSDKPEPFQIGAPAYSYVVHDKTPIIMVGVYEDGLMDINLQALKAAGKLGRLIGLDGEEMAHD